MNQLNWVRRLNNLDMAVGSSSNLINLNFNELVSEAKSATNLNDFGDESWIPFLRNSLESECNTGRKDTLVRLVLKAQSLIRLKNRLITVENLKRNPSICKEKINNPIMITGLPRSGTTILFELLNQDKAFRAPLGYETILELQQSEKNRHAQLDRNEITECLFELTMDIVPDLKFMHDHRHDLPVECADIMANMLTIPNPKFDEYGTYEHRTSTFQNNYRYKWHKIVLQALQYKAPSKTWLLKDLFHLHFLDLVFKNYPDAKIIHTHRDPASVIPSLLSILKTIGEIYPDYQIKDPRQVVSLYEGGLKKSIEQRKFNKLIDNKMTDIYFSELLKNPISTIKTIYDKNKMEFSSETKQGIQQYLASRPRDKYGTHSYNLEEFGLSEKEIRSQFKFYTDHYNIPPE